MTGGAPTERRLIAPEAGRLEYEEHEPALPGAGQVAGHTLVNLISPGTEISMAFPVEPRYPFPVGIGYATVFCVEQVGQGVSGFLPGDVVFSMGKHGSYQVADATQVIPVPDGLDPAVAVFARILNIPLAVLSTGTPDPAARVAVSGLGLIGQLTARAYAARGSRVVGVDRDGIRRGLLPPGMPVAAELEREYDVVVECSGHEDIVVDAARHLVPGGELVLVGVPWRRRTETYLYDLMDLVFHRFLVLRSGWEWQVPFLPSPRTGGISMSANLALALDWLRSGTVDVTGLATSIAPEEVFAAFDALRSRTAPTLTYVIDWRR